MKMKDQKLYEYLRQHTKLPMLKLHSFLEIEAAVDKARNLPDRVTVRRQKDLEYEQIKGKWYGFKAKAFRGATIMWEQGNHTRQGEVHESGRERMADA
jgi:hypothetical protein